MRMGDFATGAASARQRNNAIGRRSGHREYTAERTHWICNRRGAADCACRTWAPSVTDDHYGNCNNVATNRYQGSAAAEWHARPSTEQ